MAYDLQSSAAPTEVFKALGDPIRWSIVRQMAAVDELACLTLEDTLPVSKPTISYHTKILQHAGLIEVRKEGRNYFYTLRRDVLYEVLDNLWELDPTPRPVDGQRKGYMRSEPRQSNGSGRHASGAGSSGRRPSVENAEEAVVLTW